MGLDLLFMSMMSDGTIGLQDLDLVPYRCYYCWQE